MKIIAGAAASELSDLQAAERGRLDALTQSEAAKDALAALETASRQLAEPGGSVSDDHIKFIVKNMSTASGGEKLSDQDLKDSVAYIRGVGVGAWIDGQRDDLRKQVDDLSAPAQAAAADLNTQARAAGFKDHTDRVNWLSDMSNWKNYSLAPTSQQDPVEFRGWLEKVLGMTQQPAQQWAFRYTSSSRWNVSISQDTPTDRLTLTPGTGGTGDLQSLARQALAKSSLNDYWALGDGASRTTTLRANTTRVDGLAAELSYIDPNPLNGLTQADLSRELRVPVEDSETGAKFDMVLRPKHIIFHSGPALGGGHYFAYLRDGNGDWVRHDDLNKPEKSALPSIGPGLRPKLIEYEKVGLIPQ
jgi:hypothetical protein